MNTKIDGKSVTINKPIQTVFDLLKTPQNFSLIMPEDVQKFESGDDWFIFGLKGMPEVKLKVKETISPERVVLVSASDKIPFELVATFEDKAPTTQAQLSFQGQFNPMLKMMVERPLKKFLEKLSERMEAL